MAELGNLTFAAADPAALAEFWAAALGYEVQNRAAAIDPRGEGPRLLFNKREKTPTIEIPIHLDVNVVDPDAEVQRLLGLGAKLVVRTTIAIGDFSEGWTVMRDPEGNGFCVQPDTKRAEAGPFIRNITFACADPKELAAFWAEAIGYSREERGSVDDLLAAGLDPAELDAHIALAHPEDGRRPRLFFQRREKTPVTEIPIHLDLRAEDREAEVERLTQLGASVVEAKARWTVMRDPEGNAFCVQ